MRISREEKEQLKEKILVQALPALKQWGNSGAPVDKIMKHVGLTSGALYSHFKSKDDFFVQVVLHGLDARIAHHKSEVLKYGAEALPRFVEYYLSAAHLKGVEQGCLFVALGTDLHRQKASMRALFEEKIETLFEVLAGSLPQGSEAERLKLVRFVFSSLVGSLILARSVKNEETAVELMLSNKKQLLKFLKKESGDL